MNPIGGGVPLKTPGEIPGLDRLQSGRDPSRALEPSSGVDAPSFGAQMNQFLGGVNDLALHSDRVFQSFVRGEVKDLHQVALAQQEAGIAVRLVAEMRDKLIGAYQEIMRMQM